jgi:gamma-glutamyltranspeptidase/glutathione hydrolase
MTRICLPPQSEYTAVDISVPLGACDSHVHIFGPFAQFPLAEDRSYTPQEFSPDQFAAHLDRIGFTRGVLVTASVCGTNNGSMKVPPSALLDKSYLASRAALISHEQAGSYGPGDPHSGGTVYLCAADESGMMISYIQSNFKGFGSGVVAPGGIAFHNRGMSFSLIDGHPNQVAPGKRPFHTIIPAFLSKGNKPTMAFGVMGGNMQPQGHLQFVMRFVDEYLNPQACSDAPRWRIDDLGKLTVEASMPQSVVDGLRALGHEVAVQPANSLDFGSAQAIAMLDDDPNSAFIAGSDHRRDGLAAGF